MLTLADQGLLVVCVLNLLPHPQDLVEGNVDGCCPDCCAACGLLRKLHAADQLDTAVRQAPAHMWGPEWAWWVDNGVDKQWLADCWSCMSKPPCEHAE